MRESLKRYGYFGEKSLKKAIPALFALCLLAFPVWAQTTLLHEFAGGIDDGKYPWGDLIISGSTLYGMTQYGGNNDKGTIFKAQVDGSDFTLLREFAGSSIDGKYPVGSLILSGSTLYGMTFGGGIDDYGTIFKMETDGSNFILLHAFAGGSAGEYPYGSLILSGSTLYGMSQSIGGGIIFKIQTDGSDFSILHGFAIGTNDGNCPRGSLVISRSTLYGMTFDGGFYNQGTIFKMETDGSNYMLLHEFTGGIADGGSPYGSLLLSGTTLYGMTSFGITSDGVERVLGTIFKINTDGSGFALLHAFPFPFVAAEGMMPHGSLIISGSTLYGMTHGDGSTSYGTIFQIQSDGSSFTPLHIFAGGMDDGKYPEGSLVLSDSILYGLTLKGGDSDFGVAFSLPIPPSITVTSPNGGENWVVGENHDIKWMSTGVIDNVDIDYSIDDGGSWTAVAAGTENDGSFTWTVPDTPSSTCLLRVSSTASPDITDSSDFNFAISAPFVYVTAPNGGEEWQRGTTQSIAWTSAGVADIRIELMKKDKLKATIAASVPASDGVFNWAIPSSFPAGSSYKVRITSTAVPAVTDSSDACFTVFAPAGTVSD